MWSEGKLDVLADQLAQREAPGLEPPAVIARTTRVARAGLPGRFSVP
jgi:hypothetical protein